MLPNEGVEGQYIFVEDHGRSMTFGEEQESRQRQIDAVKPKSYKECQVLFGNHHGKVQKGHTIPRVSLRALSRLGHVKLFMPKPGLKDLNLLPIRRGIHEAAIGFFTCQGHDELFWPVENNQPDTSKSRHMDLLAYKAVLGATWRLKLVERAYKQQLKLDPQSEWLQYSTNYFTSSIDSIDQYKRIVEDCVRPAYRSGSGEKLKYMARSFKSAKNLAVCEWFYGGQFNIGITVYPTETGQTVVLHCVAEEWDIFDKWFGFLNGVSDEEFQELISMLVLQRCETIALAPETWNGFDETKRREIRSFFLETKQNVGFGSVEQIALWAQHEQGVFNSKTDNLNLFSGG